MWVPAQFSDMSCITSCSPHEGGGVGKMGCRSWGRCWGGGRRCPPPCPCHLLLWAKTDSQRLLVPPGPDPGCPWMSCPLKDSRACFAKAAVITAALLPASCLVSTSLWLSSPLQGTAMVLSDLPSPQVVECWKKLRKTWSVFLVWAVFCFGQKVRPYTSPMSGSISSDFLSYFNARWMEKGHPGRRLSESSWNTTIQTCHVEDKPTGKVTPASWQLQFPSPERAQQGSSKGWIADLCHPAPQKHLLAWAVI